MVTGRVIPALRAPIDITYVTSSEYKREENAILVEHATLADGRAVGELFNFRFRTLAVKELLESDIVHMVEAEVASAYSVLKVPCIVEHAGLIFADYAAQSYPGGLTKPMWNTLSGDFVRETNSANRSAVARAVVAYCDGMTVHTFIGETQGKIASEPRGSREFYWDTVFIPSENNPEDLTYAEIVAAPDLGLQHKALQHSQSTKAMLEFLTWRITHKPSLWEVTY